MIISLLGLERLEKARENRVRRCVILALCLHQRTQLRDLLGLHGSRFTEWRADQPEYSYSIRTQYSAAKLWQCTRVPRC